MGNESSTTASQDDRSIHDSSTRSHGSNESVSNTSNSLNQTTSPKQSSKIASLFRSSNKVKDKKEEEADSSLDTNTPNLVSNVAEQKKQVWRRQREDQNKKKKGAQEQQQAKHQQSLTYPKNIERVSISKSALKQKQSYQQSNSQVSSSVSYQGSNTDNDSINPDFYPPITSQTNESSNESIRNPSGLGLMSSSNVGTMSSSSSKVENIIPLLNNVHIEKSASKRAINTKFEQSLSAKTIKYQPARRSNDEECWEKAWDTDDESSEDGGEDEDADSLNEDDDSAQFYQTKSSSTTLESQQPIGAKRENSNVPLTMHIDDDDVDVASVTQISSQVSVAKISRQGRHNGETLPPISLLQQQNEPQHMLYNLPQHKEQQCLAPREVEETILTKEMDKVLSEGENSVSWDTLSVAQDTEIGYEKPNIRMFYPLLRVLGKGSFGKVVLVQKNAGEECGGLFAMKILRKSHLVKRRQIERTRTERKVLAVVDHPFIMKLHFAFQTEDKLFLVLDYCAGGELFFHLSRLRRFPERVARFYAAELLLAIGHLHKKHIIYRDLKPENVLLDSEGHVKLGDFGLAKDKIDHPYRGASSMCGTPEYMAPEILQQFGHGFCVDYWGLGMLVYEMMTGLPPWYTTDRQKLFRRLKSAPLEIPSFFSPQSSSVTSALLQRDPRRRLGVRGVRSVIAHDFFRGLDFRALLHRRIEVPIRPCEGWNTPDISYDQTKNINNKQSAGQRNSRIQSNDLDAATANFDQNFTRMSVNSIGGHDDSNYSCGDGEQEELHEKTFVGFTFDEQDDTNNLNHCKASSNEISSTSRKKPSNGSHP